MYIYICMCMYIHINIIYIYDTYMYIYIQYISNTYSVENKIFQKKSVKKVIFRILCF